MNKEQIIKILANHYKKALNGDYQNIKCNWYYTFFNIKKCCSMKEICPYNYPKLLCPKYKNDDCCDIGGNIIIYNKCYTNK